MSGLKRNVNLFVVLIIVFLCLGLMSCGTGSESSDGDSDLQTDGDNDSLTEQDLITPFDGYWLLKDSTAIKWYNKNDIKSFYLIIENGEFSFFMVDSEGTSYCTKQAMSSSNGLRFVPQLDPDNCWYDLKIGERDKLVINTRNRNDPDSLEAAWYFVFQRVLLVPDYDYSQCNSLDKCVSYFIE